MYKRKPYKKKHWELSCPLSLNQKEEETGWTFLSPDIWVSLAESQPPIAGAVFLTFWKSAQSRKLEETAALLRRDRRVSSGRGLHKLLHLGLAGQGWAECQAVRQRAGTHAALGRTQLIWSRTLATAPTNDSVTYPRLLSYALQKPIRQI